MRSSGLCGNAMGPSPWYWAGWNWLGDCSMRFQASRGAAPAVLRRESAPCWAPGAPRAHPAPAQALCPCSAHTAGAGEHQEQGMSPQTLPKAALPLLPAAGSARSLEGFPAGEGLPNPRAALHPRSKHVPHVLSSLNAQAPSGSPFFPVNCRLQMNSYGECSESRVGALAAFSHPLFCSICQEV